MSSNIWKMSEVLDIPLDKGDVIEGLTKKLHNIEFTNETGDSVYPVEIERTNFDKLVITMSDETVFTLICE